MVSSFDVTSAAHFKAGYYAFVTSAVGNKGSVFVGFLLMTLLNVVEGQVSSNMWIFF